MVALEACPFCGATPKYSRIAGQGFSVLCNGCGAIAVYGRGGGRDALGRAWNRRTVRHNLSVQSRVAPCPFCASRQVRRAATKGGDVLECGGCGMLVSFAYGDDLAGTVQRWNSRV